MRPFLRFFFSPSAPEPEEALAVFFAAFAPPSEVVFAGALEAVEAGALPAVEAGLGAIGDNSRVGGVVGSVERVAGRGRREMDEGDEGETRPYLCRRVVLVWRDASTR